MLGQLYNGAFDLVIPMHFLSFLFAFRSDLNWNVLFDIPIHFQSFLKVTNIMCRNFFNFFKVFYCFDAKCFIASWHRYVVHFQGFLHFWCKIYNCQFVLRYPLQNEGRICDKMYWPGYLDIPVNFQGFLHCCSNKCQYVVKVAIGSDSKNEIVLSN